MNLTLPVPPSVNTMFRNVPKVGRVKTKAYRQWLKEADQYFFMQKRRIEAVAGEYEVEIRVPKTMRGDVDNRTKAVLDFLVSREITEDDRNCRKVTIERSADTWLCEVTITAVEPRPALVAAMGSTL
jgi:crossover junction endodeoxyribonuclease RusA